MTSSYYSFLLVSFTVSLPHPTISLLSSSPLSFLPTRAFRPTISTLSSSSSSLNCICINCAYVTNCQAYNFVEKQHIQPHISPDPTFMPRDGSPTIHVNIRKDMGGIWDGEAQGDKPVDFIGQLDQTTYEYDVVKCEDYIEDFDCWIRNMPQEIKDANPHFVPT